MPTPELDNLVRAGILLEEPPNREEFEGLLRSAAARLKDALHTDNSPDSRFDLAYNAAHALALAALRWHGYRSNNKRYIVFQALEHTVGFAPSDWRVLDKCHGHRNRMEYGGIAPVEEHLLTALVRVTTELLNRVRSLPLPSAGGG